MEEAGAACCTRLPVLYNSSSFFPLSLTRSAATTSIPHSPPDSTRFQPPSSPRASEQAPASSRRQWVSSGIGNKLCLAEPARKITGRPEIRARRAAAMAKEKSCRRSILLDEFFVCGSGNKSGPGVPGDLSIPTLTFEFL